MVKTNSNSLHVTTAYVPKEPISNFNLTSIIRGKVPDHQTVDLLFEKLLSVRAFSDEAVYTLRNQSYERKWELILRENETNSNFDLDRLFLQTHLKYPSQMHTYIMANNNSTDIFLPSSLPQLEKNASSNQESEKSESIFSIDSKKSHFSMSNIEKTPKEGTPEWFVSRILAGKLTLKDLKKLEKRLNNEVASDDKYSDWRQKFLLSQGETALAVILSKISKKSIKSNEEFDKEYLLVQCLKYIIDYKHEGEEEERQEEEGIEVNEVVDANATDILKNKTILINALVYSIMSPKIVTRTIVTEVLITLMIDRPDEVYHVILTQFRNLQNVSMISSRFQAWLASFEATLPQTSRGKAFAHLKNYIIITLVLINCIVELAGSVKRRMSVRLELNDANILRIFDKIKSFDNDRIRGQLERYNSYAADDRELLLAEKKEKLESDSQSETRGCSIETCSEESSSFADHHHRHNHHHHYHEGYKEVEVEVEETKSRIPEDAKVILRSSPRKSNSTHSGGFEAAQENIKLNPSNQNNPSYSSNAGNASNAGKSSKSRTGARGSSTTTTKVDTLEKRQDLSTKIQSVLSKLVRLEKSSPSNSSSGNMGQATLLVDCLLDQLSNTVGKTTIPDQISSMTIQRLIDGLASEMVARNAIAEMRDQRKELQRLKEANRSLKKALKESVTAAKAAAAAAAAAAATTTTTTTTSKESAPENASQTETIAQQSKQISLLQRQIKGLEQEKNKMARNRGIYHSFEDANDTRAQQESAIGKRGVLANVPSNESLPVYANASYAKLNDSQASSIKRSSTPPGLFAKLASAPSSDQGRGTFQSGNSFEAFSHSCSSKGRAGAEAEAASTARDNILAGPPFSNSHSTSTLSLEQQAAHSILSTTFKSHTQRHDATIPVEDSTLLVGSYPEGRPFLSQNQTPERTLSQFSIDSYHSSSRTLNPDLPPPLLTHAANSTTSGIYPTPSLAPPVHSSFSDQSALASDNNNLTLNAHSVILPRIPPPSILMTNSKATSVIGPAPPAAPPLPLKLDTTLKAPPAPAPAPAAPAAPPAPAPAPAPPAPIPPPPPPLPPSLSTPSSVPLPPPLPPPFPLPLSLPLPSSSHGTPVAPPLPPSFPLPNSGSTRPASQKAAAVIESPAVESMSCIRPKARMKQIHWNKINDVENTFWVDIEEESLTEKLLENGIYDEVERIFAASVSTIKKRSDLNANNNSIQRDVKEAVPKVSILSRDLAQQFGINLHMFAGDSEEKFVLKVLKCSPEVMENSSVIEFFNSEQLNEISDSLAKRFLPYASDPRSTEKPKKDPNELERADRIFLELCINLRHYWKARSKALLFIQTFEKDEHDLQSALKSIDQCVEHLKSCENLRKVLGIIKLIGNFMNEHSKQASGFKLDTLQRLKFMKDEVNSLSFLHHLEKIVRQTFPEYSSFVDELSSLNEVQNISLEQLEADCNEMTKSVKIITDAIEKGKLSRPNDLHASDRILAVVDSPMKKAQSKSCALQSHLKETMSEFNSLMVFFGENPDAGGGKDSFFLKIMTFVAEFKKAHVENIQLEEEQKVYENRKKKIEEKLMSKPNSSKDSLNSEDLDKNIADSLDESSAVIDLLLEKLRSDAFKRHRTKRKEPQAPTRVSTGEELTKTANLDTREMKEYESVNTLKRRLTARKRTADASAIQSNSGVSRAEAMLHHLRKEAGEEDEGGDSALLPD
ncbi:uncharacterized protein LODBEIA_P10410 [Lodderomyces beijingensis]|uniref:FH2 domain-containing protein n=1 Tax=Lodderomyces beijingensis TaxID=1775926 RepID=A0ABP0ZHC9_9ASCO